MNLLIGNQNTLHLCGVFSLVDQKCSASACAIPLKILRRKRFRKPRKKIATQAQV